MGRETEKLIETTNMSFWEIFLIIYVIATIIAIMFGIYEFIRIRKRCGHWDFPNLLAGPFLPILFIFYGLLLLMSKVEDLYETWKGRKVEALMEQHHVSRFSVSLKDLPFIPSSNELIYIENDYHEATDTFIKDNIETIQERLDKNKKVRLRFIYLPYLAKNLAKDFDALSYISPSIHANQDLNHVELTSSSLLDYMEKPENRKYIEPCFAWFTGMEEGCATFSCIGFDIGQRRNDKDFIDFICSSFDFFPISRGRKYQMKKADEKERNNIEVLDVDSNFELTSELILKELKEKINQLRKMGVSQWVLEQLVKPQETISHLVISKDHRIFLPEYNNMEINMEPLVKAVFFLFLKHPEGIIFKHLPDYREELTNIYKDLRPLGLSAKTIQSIEDVTNPCNNSINEKCARIHAAFTREFDDHLAQNYYITGKRGMEKKISLPRDMVVWE